MNILDWALVALVAAYALSGYWQGFITGAFSTVGLVLGGLFGIWAAPRLLGNVAPSIWVSLGALFVVLVCASFGQGVLQYVGTRARATIRWQPVRALDAVGGAALSVVAVLLVVWTLGVAISGSSIPGISRLARTSKVLGTVNAAMPLQAYTALRAFDNVVGSSVFPRYLEPFAPERIVHVAPAPRHLVHDPDVVRAAKAVYKVRGENVCGNGVEGTGFLFSPDRLMTNAHVVAGVRQPEVRSGNGEVSATVVYYNPNVDVAVLDVHGLNGPSLHFDVNGRPGQPGVALGYPNDGPFDAEPVRIRNQQRLRSPNIYGTGTVTRDVFSLRGSIRPGNSGGPFVSTAGRVLGMVFAASVSDARTGYALTADQLARSAAAGLAAHREVSTHGCA